MVGGILRGNHHTVTFAPVDLQTLANDGVTWTVVASGTSGRHGKVTFLQADSQGTSYRLAYAGSDRLAPCVSGVVVG